MENVIIIGGGPAGLAASLYLARANLSPIVFAGSLPGGQLILTGDVENYPGIDTILGPDLIQKYRTHAVKFGAKIIDQNITNADFSKSPFNLNTAEKSYLGKTVIIATGAKALWLGLESETRLRGKGVSACATCDGFFFKNKVVAVVGGGDTAMEEALTLTKFASKIYIFHRRGEFRASKIMQERVFKNPKIEVIWNTQVMEVLGENKVEGIKLQKIKNDSEQNLSRVNSSLRSSDTNSRKFFSSSSLLVTTLPIDGLFIAIGHKPDTDLFKGQIELDNKGYILTFNRLAEEYLSGRIEVLPEKLTKIRSGIELYSYHTSVSGVFAAGDCVDHKYRQAGTAVGMGIAAALEVERWLESEMSV